MSADGGFPEGWFAYSNNVQSLTAESASQQKQAGKQFSLESQLTVNQNLTQTNTYDLKFENVKMFTLACARVLARSPKARGATERERRERGTRRWGIHSQIEWRGPERGGLTQRLIHAITKLVW